MPRRVSEQQLTDKITEYLGVALKNAEPAMKDYFFAKKESYILQLQDKAYETVAKQYEQKLTDEQRQTIEDNKSKSWKKEQEAENRIEEAARKIVNDNRHKIHPDFGTDEMVRHMKSTLIAAAETKFKSQQDAIKRDAAGSLIDEMLGMKKPEGKFIDMLKTSQGVYHYRPPRSGR